MSQDPKLTHHKSNELTESPPVRPVSGTVSSQLQLDLLELLRALVRQKWVIVSATALVAVLSGVYAIFATPVYRAEVLFVPADSVDQETGQLSALASQFGGLTSLAGLSFQEGGGTETALAILQSRRFVTQFIGENDLLPVLYPDRWDDEQGQWIPLQPSWLKRIVSGDQEPKIQPSMWAAYQYMIDKVMFVSRDVGTGLITLSIEWEDAELAAQWANDIIARVNNHIRRQAIDEAERNIAFLRAQLDEMNLVELREILFALLGRQAKDIMMANVREQYAFTIIDPAVVPEVSARPRRLLILILGIALGGMLGLLLAVVRIMKDDSEHFLVNPTGETS